MTLKKYSLLFVKTKLIAILFLPLMYSTAPKMSAQIPPIRDYLLTQTIYNDTFVSESSLHEDSIARILMSKDLDQWVNDSLINTDNMRDFAMPLGLFKRSDSVNFSRGMTDMWRAKAYFINARSEQMQSRIFLTAMQAAEANMQAKNTMTLREYRETIISPATGEIQDKHESLKPLYSDDRAIFMSLIAQNISPNVMLGFNIQELLPPTHQLADGRILPVNPVFKACYLDRVLREAGTEFIRYFPSRFDQILSYGPFQLTPIAFADIQLNNRLSDDFKKYKSFDDLHSINDHVLMAALFAYNNWERLSYLLQSDSSIEKFNNYFADVDKDDEKKRKLQIFVAGMTACLHHHPPNTNKMIRAYLKESDSLDKLHYDCIEKKGSKQLKKYYKSSAEAFLLMKVYHILIEKYDN